MKLVEFKLTDARGSIFVNPDHIAYISTWEDAGTNQTHIGFSGGNLATVIGSAEEVRKTIITEIERRSEYKIY